MDEFTIGLAVVLGCLIRQHDLPSVAVDIMRSNGLTIRDFHGKGVDVFDMELIEKAWKERGGK